MKNLSISLVSGFLAVGGLTGCQHMQGDSASAPAALFDGKSLAGWTAVTADPAVPQAAVWSVQEGAIVCQGKPVGFIYEARDFTNFRLSVEYRWPAGKEPGNSGIFSRINDVSKPLPRCIECQLKHGSAGDVLGLQGMEIVKAQPRFFSVAKHALAGDIAGVNKTTDAEKAVGEWNHVEILAQGSTYTVWVNGQKVNEATGVETLPGKIGLQSEGGEIHFRNVQVTALP